MMDLLIALLCGVVATAFGVLGALVETRNTEHDHDLMRSATAWAVTPVATPSAPGEQGGGPDSHATATPMTEHDSRRLSKLLFRARETAEMFADVVEARTGQTATAVHELIHDIDQYRAEYGWSPDGYGNER